MSDHHDNLPSFCHPVSVKLLLAVFVSLIGLTILTVVVSSLGPAAGMPHDFMFPAAMFIATLKALLVCAFFMHMWWEKGINIFAFLSSLFFVCLFIGITWIDTSANQNAIDQFPREPAAVVTPAE
jgi:cytochrome c oxidase subunit 4